MELALVAFVILIALVFDYTNGFHDAANAVATSVSTRALTPQVAVLMAAVFNVLGAFLGEGVARAISSGVVLPGGGRGLLILLAALAGAIAWNLATWSRGLPSSSSHALVGGLGGAGLAAGLEVHSQMFLDTVFVAMLVSPLGGFLLAYLAMAGVQWVFRRADRRVVNRRFRLAQTFSAAAMSLGHGLQDAQKTMAVIVLALVAGGYHAGDDIPVWVTLSAALAIGLGTYAGGWRIVRTLGRRIVELDPARGFAAETVSAGVLYVAAIGFHAPVSTTHTIGSAIVGVGATRRLSAVRWGVVRTMVLAWVLTLPASAVCGALAYALLARLS